VRILVLSRYYPYPLDRGSNLRVYPHLKYLARRHTVDLVTFEREGDDPAPGLGELQKICRHVDVVPEEWHPLGRAARLRALASRTPRGIVQGHAAGMERAIAARMGRESYDAILCEWLYVAPYAERWGNVARVLDDHNAEAAAYERALRLEGGSFAQRARARLSWAMLYDFERRMVRAFDGVAAVSDVDAAYLRRMADDPGKVATVPNAVDLETVTRWTGPRTPGQLVYPGSLTYEPNMDACMHFAREVLPRVRRERPAARLVITGKLPPSVPSELRDDPGVELLGLVPDVRPVVGQSELVVVPLRRGGGTRLKILEAFGVGTAVVATSVGAEGIDASSGREIAVADAPDALAQTIVRLLGDAAERERLARAARDLAERKYSCAAAVDALDGLIHRAVARRLRRVA
jgi:glycosyltransferase involved in cell wall biosynthesis